MPELGILLSNRTDTQARFTAVLPTLVAPASFAAELAPVPYPTVPLATNMGVRLGRVAALKMIFCATEALPKPAMTAEDRACEIMDEVSVLFGSDFSGNARFYRANR